MKILLNERQSELILKHAIKDDWIYEISEKFCISATIVYEIWKKSIVKYFSRVGNNSQYPEQQTYLISSKEMLWSSYRKSYTLRLKVFNLIMKYPKLLQLHLFWNIIFYFDANLESREQNFASQNNFDTCTFFVWKIFFW